MPAHSKTDVSLKSAFIRVICGKKTISDVFTKAKRSEVMSRIRGSGNKDTELSVDAAEGF